MWRESLSKMRRSFPSIVAIMNRNLTLLLLVSCPLVVKSWTTDDLQAHNMSVATNASEAEKSVEEKLKDLRIEMVKFQILSKLNMKKTPPPAAPPSEFSREAIRILLEEAGEQSQVLYHPFDSEERLIIYAKSGERECLQTNESFCKMFRYEFSKVLNMSTMDLWVYKVRELPRWISVSLSSSHLSEEKYYDRFYFEVKLAGWNKLPLPRIFLPPSWNDTVSYHVEISGENIEHHGDRRPFLMVSKSFSMASRQRRDISCDTNESCCLKPLRVSFAEIGFNWVLYPVELEANMCTGTCRMDQGTMRTHYERAMTKVIEKDSTLQGSLGECWTLCCKPKQLEAVRVIYNDTDGIIHDQYIPELSVTSCSCS